MSTMDSMSFATAMAAAVTVMLISFALEAFFRLFRRVFTAVLVVTLIGLPVTVAVSQRI